MKHSRPASGPPEQRAPGSAPRRGFQRWLSFSGGHAGFLAVALRTSLLLLLLNVAADNLLLLTLPLKRFVLVSLWLLFTWLNVPFANGALRRNLLCALGWALAPAALLLCAAHPVHQSAALLAGLAGLSLAGPGPESRTRGLPLLVLTAALYTLFLIFRCAVPACGRLLEWLAAPCCAVAAALLNSGLVLGPDYVGLPVTACFVLGHLGLLAFSQPRRATLAAVMVGLQGLLVPLYLVLRHALLNPLKDPQQFLAVADWQILLFLLGLPLLLAHAWLTPPAPAVWPPGPRRAPALLAALAAAAGGALLAWFPPLTVPRGLRIAFHDAGFLDWNKPVFNRYGGTSGGMLGLLPAHLATGGHVVEVGPVSRDRLRGKDLLFIFNPRDRFSPEVTEAIWDFVRAGGSLLAMGDHTCRETIREPLNELLERVRISLNFDSAIFLSEPWRNFQMDAHFAPLGAFDPSATQIRIGASLAVRPPGRPAIIARDGFSDKGDLQRKDRGYLGDMRYSADERLGDLILAASATYGQGKVFVLGDTTTFQNGALPIRLPFINHIFAWLRSPNGIFAAAWSPAALALGLVLLLLAVSRTRPLLVVCALAASGAFALVSLRPAAAQRAPSAIRRQPAAYIDESHLERFDPNPWQPGGIGGLVYNLMRNGTLPYMAARFPPADLAPGDVLFLLAPARPFSPADLRVLDAFVEQGGRLVITAGYDGLESTRRLLEHFQFRVEAVPLGPLGTNLNSRGINFSEAWAVRAEGPAAETLCTAWNYPVIARQRRGQGTVLLVGDKNFFCNRNLEDIRSYSVPNILFLRYLFTTCFMKEK